MGLGASLGQDLKSSLDGSYPPIPLICDTAQYRALTPPFASRLTSFLSSMHRISTSLFMASSCHFCTSNQIMLIANLKTRTDLLDQQTWRAQQNSAQESVAVSASVSVPSWVTLLQTCCHNFVGSCLRRLRMIRPFSAFQFVKAFASGTLGQIYTQKDDNGITFVDTSLYQQTDL